MRAQGFKSIEIKSCRSCHSTNLKLILDLGDLYLSDFTKSKKTRPAKYPLTLLVCSSCHLVQLKHTTPPQKLYTERYGYRSGINNTMRVELKEIVTKSIKKARLKKGEMVIDIGANDGTLLSFYPKNVKRIGVEPVKKFSKDSKKFADLIIKNFFEEKRVKPHLKGERAKIITAISMFYDLPDPNKFLSDVKSLLSDDGIFVIQQNYLATMLSLNAFDNIVHEHLEYYSLISLEKLLERNGLRVFDVEETIINGGSFRTYIARTESKYKTTSRVIEMRKKEKRMKLDNKSTYVKFSKNVSSLRDKVKKTISSEIKKGKTVYIYGASTRGNTLIQYCDIDSTTIPYAIERNSEKWGRYIASVGIPIISEEEARKKMPDNMLVLPWFFKDEFIKREASYLKKGGRFIFPMPKFEIVSLAKSNNKKSHKSVHNLRKI